MVFPWLCSSLRFSSAVAKGNKLWSCGWALSRRQTMEGAEKRVFKRNITTCPLKGRGCSLKFYELIKRIILHFDVELVLCAVQVCVANRWGKQSRYRSECHCLRTAVNSRGFVKLWNCIAASGLGNLVEDEKVPLDTDLTCKSIWRHLIGNGFIF